MKPLVLLGLIVMPVLFARLADPDPARTDAAAAAAYSAILRESYRAPEQPAPIKPDATPVREEPAIDVSPAIAPAPPIQHVPVEEFPGRSRFRGRR